MSRLFVYLSSLLIIVACSTPVRESSTETQTQATPTQAAGAIDGQNTPALGGDGGLVTGRIGSTPAAWEGHEIRVYTCPFYSTTEGEGFYVLEATVHRFGLVTETGRFEIRDVPPGRYAIVVGPSPEESVVAQDSGRAMIVEVKAGQVYDFEINLP